MQTEIKSIISLYSNGQIQEALDSVGALIKDYPNEPLLYNISGICYKAIGQRDAAVKSFERALAIKQDFADAHNNLGVTLQELGQLEAAVKHYEEALAIRPDYAEAHNNFGVTLQELGQLEAAVKHYEEALAIRPDYAEAHNNLGITLKELGQLDAAVKSYEKTIVIKPNFAEAHNNLGITLKELGQLDTAVRSYEKALAIKPDFAEAHNNLGNVFKDLGQLDTAVKSYEKALAIKPDYAEVHNNLGNALKELGQLDAAFNCYEKTLAIKPEFAEANYNRGNVLKGLKRLDEALASYERAYILKPDIDFLLGDLLHTKMDLCIWDDLPSQLDEFKNKINNSEKVIHPFPVLALIDDPEIQRKTAEIFANEKDSQSHLLSKIERYPKHTKIRIGYFSADFRDHPVSHLTAELYEIHDRNRFEIHAFSFGPDTQDEMNLRIKAGVDHFHDVRSMSHKEVAMLARSLEIDIAVDLTGFTKNARTEIFALSAAPIQASYIGYIGTMGANYYDYLVADQTMIPEKNQKYFSEKIVYLPSYQANDSTQSPPEIFFTRHDLGLPEEGFVFCCFNNTFKITPTTFDSWGRILEQVEGSVLLIYANNESAKLNLTKEIVLRGIDPSRLIFGEKLPMSEYLARYRVVDLFLDTHPYNAGTIASGALRMGLPVLTCIGNSFASRMGASVINAVNLPELITTTQKEYELLAIELATHPEQLKSIKEKLIKNLPTAPLYDTPLFTRHLESAYRTMYDRYQQGLETDHIYVERYK